MSAKPFILIPRRVTEHIASSSDSTQKLHMKHLPSEDLYVVNRFTSGDARLDIDIPREYTTLNWQSAADVVGQWFRAPTWAVNALHFDLLRRPTTSIEFKDFKAQVPGVLDPGSHMGFVITYAAAIPEEAAEVGVQRFAGWLVTRKGVRAIPLAVEPETLGLGQLSAQWPVASLATDTVIVVGVGSIGGVVAENLAAMGVGHTMLIDPDRFLWHNVVRHVLGPESVGRYKVDAMRDRLRERWPEHDSMALRYDVVEQADLVRPLMSDAHLIVCAADGIAPRRVVSHLARRARIPAVLACVLDDGGIGEVLRLRSGPRFGCLLCHRADLAARGAIDPEADQELAYGTGRVHKPMTAIPTDLAAVGLMAAKVAASTLLESRHGEPQRLPGEQAVIGLRADLGLADPYDVSAVGEVAWRDIPAPRANCPTCGPA